MAWLPTYWPVSRTACLLFGDNVFRLRAFLSLCNFHRDFLAFFQCFESFHLDGTVVNEYILSPFVLDESESFIVVEPLYGSRNSFA